MAEKTRREEGTISNTEVEECKNTDLREERSKSARKIKKSLRNLGMQQVTEIVSVIFKKRDGSIFEIAKPDVFKTSGSDNCYVAFGLLHSNV